MQTICFSTEETNWRAPRFGILLAKGNTDTGFRLDCEKLFDPSKRPADLLSWFDVDGPWFQEARKTYDALINDEQALMRANDQGLSLIHI